MRPLKPVYGNLFGFRTFKGGQSRQCSRSRPELGFTAAEFAKGTLSEAGKDAYKALKEAVVRMVLPSYLG